MALTAEEKEQRRIARNARDRAHNARRRERQILEDAGKAEILERLSPEITAADAAENVMFSERQRALEDIDRTISALQEQKKVLQEDYHDRLAPLRDATREAWQRKTEAERELQKALDDQFPDLKGAASYSAACWKPID